LTGGARPEANARSEAVGYGRRPRARRITRARAFASIAAAPAIALSQSKQDFVAALEVKTTRGDFGETRGRFRGGFLPVVFERAVA
jgi:hypothetical protein